VQELFARLVAQGQHERAAAISDPDEQSAFLLARLRTHLIKRWRHRTRYCFRWWSDLAGRAGC
jgi:hypothetical protein